MRSSDQRPIRRLDGVTARRRGADMCAPSPAGRRRSVARFGAAIIRARDRFARARVWWGNPRCEHLPPIRAPSCSPTMRAPSGLRAFRRTIADRGYGALGRRKCAVARQGGVGVTARVAGRFGPAAVSRGLRHAAAHVVMIDGRQPALTAVAPRSTVDSSCSRHETRLCGGRRGPMMSAITWVVLAVRTKARSSVRKRWAPASARAPRVSAVNRQRTPRGLGRDRGPRRP
jgi:hypothetical protein